MSEANTAYSGIQWLQWFCMWSSAPSPVEQLPARPCALRAGNDTTNNCTTNNTTVRSALLLPTSTRKSGKLLRVAVSALRSITASFLKPRREFEAQYKQQEHALPIRVVPAP